MSNFLHRKIKQRHTSEGQGGNSEQNAGYLQALVMLGFLFIGFFSGQMLFQDGLSLKTEQAMAYFTPGDNCTQKIVDVIDETKHEIYMQAYGFTSEPICQALVRAADRGVIVRILLDRSNAEALDSRTARTAQEKRTYELLAHLKDKAEIKIDHVPGIAHNKVILADDVLITGSFNFTTAAQTRNAENILIIRNKALVGIYEKNWQKRYENAIKSLDMAASVCIIEKNSIDEEASNISDIDTEAATIMTEATDYDTSNTDINDAKRDVQEAVQAFSARKVSDKQHKFRKSSKDINSRSKQQSSQGIDQKVRMSRTGRAWRTV